MAAEPSVDLAQAAPSFGTFAQPSFDFPSFCPSPNPTIIGAALTSTSLRITFNAPVLNNPALNAIENYTFSPTLSVYSVTPGPGVNPSYVDLTTSEMKQGQSYVPTIHLVEKA